jgi:hypothetical protein
LENVEVRNLLIETQAGKPAAGQMHAQLLHQLAFIGDAMQVADQQDAKQKLRINRRTAGLAVTLLQPPSVITSKAANGSILP